MLGDVKEISDQGAVEKTISQRGRSCDAPIKIFSGLVTDLYGARRSSARSPARLPGQRFQLRRSLDAPALQTLFGPLAGKVRRNSEHLWEEGRLTGIPAHSNGGELSKRTLIAHLTLNLWTAKAIDILFRPWQMTVARAKQKERFASVPGAVSLYKFPLASSASVLRHADGLLLDELGSRV